MYKILLSAKVYCANYRARMRVSLFCMACAVLPASAWADEAEQAGTQSPGQSSAVFWNEFSLDRNQNWGSREEAFRDGWVEGKLATALALNKHLSRSGIAVSVTDTTAVLAGRVDSEIDKELAENIALGIEGVDQVNNTLTVESQRSADAGGTAQTFQRTSSSVGDFPQFIADISTTTAVKAGIEDSEGIDGFVIDVNTKGNVVTLKGNVASQAQKDLAEALAKKYSAADQIDNQIEVQQRGSKGDNMASSQANP